MGRSLGRRDEASARDQMASHRINYRSIALARLHLADGSLVCAVDHSKHDRADLVVEFPASCGGVVIPADKQNSGDYFIGLREMWLGFWMINSFIPGRCGNNFEILIFKLIIQNNMPQNLTNENSTLVQVMLLDNKTLPGLVLTHIYTWMAQDPNTETSTLVQVMLLDNKTLPELVLTHIYIYGWHRTLILRHQHWFRSCCRTPRHCLG